jgi:hypothetical protein
MNDAELNELLKSARVPERPDAYWERFPKRVILRVQDREARRETSRAGPGFSRIFQTWGIRLALTSGLVLLTIAAFWWRKSQSVSRDRDFVKVQKYFHEIDTLFPRQVRAIVFDGHGARMLLAEKPNVPDSPPVYLKICNGKSCQELVTFSGQRVEVNNDLCEVLITRQDEVIIIGEKLFWGSHGFKAPTQYRIEAKLL